MTGHRIDFHQPETLMAPIDLLISERTAVLAPAPARRAKIDAIDMTFDLFLGGHIEQVQLVGSELVARQRIFPCMQLRPPTASRRRFDEINFFPLRGLDAKGN